jgi:hypothetical protein
MTVKDYFDANGDSSVPRASRYRRDDSDKLSALTVGQRVLPLKRPYSPPDRQALRNLPAMHRSQTMSKKFNTRSFS